MVNELKRAWYKTKRFLAKNHYYVPLIIIILLLVGIVFVCLSPFVYQYITNEGNIYGDDDTTTTYIYNDIIYDDGIFVHKDGDGSTGDNWEEGYTTLNKAISETSVDLDDKTIIFVGFGLFDVNVANCLLINKNVHIVGSGRDGTIFTNTHADAEYVLNVTRYFKAEHFAILYSSDLNGINVYGDSDAHLIHMKFFDDGEGNYYPATYSFEDDTVGLIPDGFTIENGGGTANIIETLGGHDMVLDIFDDEAADFMRVTQLFTAGNQESGTVEYWVRTDDANLESHTQFRDDTLAVGFFVGIRLDGFFYYDGGYNVIVGGALDDTWHQIRIDFECGAGGYMDLAADTYYVYIDGVRYGAFPFWNVQDDIGNICFQSDTPPADYHQFIDALDYSWERPNVLHLIGGGHGEFEDLHLGGENLNSIAINISESRHNHFWDIELHSCDTGINIIGDKAQNNVFENIIIMESVIGLDIDGGAYQHFQDVHFEECDYAVDDEIGNSYWVDISSDNMLGAVTPSNLVGIVVNTNIAGDVYGVDTLVYDGTASDIPYYLIAVLFEPDVKEKYGLRLWQGIGYFYETVIEAKFLDEIDRHTIEIPTFFNAHTAIYCSIMSETGGNDMDIWLEIVAI